MNTAIYTCDTGYNLTGDTVRICQSNGYWNGSDSTCSRKLPIAHVAILIVTENQLLYFSMHAVVDCGNLTVPMNGMVNTSSGTNSLMRATYTCNTGYTLTGEATRACQSNGTWSGSEPTCNSMLSQYY